MKRGMKRGGGFTLLEVLIATVLAMVVAGLCLSVFISARKTVERATARLELHQRARVLYETLAAAAGSMQHTTAMVAYSQAADRSSPQALAATPGQVSLLFMRGTPQDTDWTNVGGLTARTIGMDLIWERWDWDRSSQSFRVARTRKISVFNNPNPAWQSADQKIKWTSPGRFAVIVQPHRTFDLGNATSPAAKWSQVHLGLDSNAWGSGLTATDNIGDATDLDQRSSSLMEGVQDLAIDLVDDGGGAPYRLDDSGDSFNMYDGLYVDGTTDEAAVRERPRLLRFRFSLVSRNGALSQVFTYSFPLTPFEPL